MRIKILDTAERDLVIGHNFYEGQAPGLGEYVLDCRKDPAANIERLN